MAAPDVEPEIKLPYWVFRVLLSAAAELERTSIQIADEPTAARLGPAVTYARTLLPRA